MALKNIYCKIVILTYLFPALLAQFYDLSNFTNNGLTYPCSGPVNGIWKFEDVNNYPGGPTEGSVLTSQNDKASCIKTVGLITTTPDVKFNIKVYVPYSTPQDVMNVWLITKDEIYNYEWFKITGSINPGEEWIEKSFPIPQEHNNDEFYIEIWDTSPRHAVSLRYFHITDQDITTGFVTPPTTPTTESSTELETTESSTDSTTKTSTEITETSTEITETSTEITETSTEITDTTTETMAVTSDTTPETTIEITETSTEITDITTESTVSSTEMTFEPSTSKLSTELTTNYISTTTEFTLSSDEITSSEPTQSPNDLNNNFWWGFWIGVAVGVIFTTIMFILVTWCWWFACVRWRSRSNPVLPSNSKVLPRLEVVSASGSNVSITARSQPPSYRDTWTRSSSNWSYRK